MTIKNISITGAAGNIAYSLIFRILSNLPFKDTNKVNLNLLDIPSSQKSLLGLKYEVEDCAFESLNKILIQINLRLTQTSSHPHHLSHFAMQSCCNWCRWSAF